MANTLLDVVNENDEIIGQALRSEIHAKGLWHREVGVWFIMADQQIIFQKRSNKVDYHRNKLTITVGGHVEQGMTYEQAILQEVLEEAGLVLKENDLHLLEYTNADKTDLETSVHNRAFRKIYCHFFRGNVSDLQVEEEMADGFIAYPLASILSQDPETIRQLGSYADPSRFPMYENIAKLVL